MNGAVMARAVLKADRDDRLPARPTRPIVESFPIQHRRHRTSPQPMVRGLPPQIYLPEQLVHTLPVFFLFLPEANCFDTPRPFRNALFVQLRTGNGPSGCTRRRRRGAKRLACWHRASGLDLLLSGTPPRARERIDANPRYPFLFRGKEVPARGKRAKRPPAEDSRGGARDDGSGAHGRSAQFAVREERKAADGAAVTAGSLGVAAGP
jgi:hypothetical protein